MTFCPNRSPTSCSLPASVPCCAAAPASVRWSSASPASGSTLRAGESGEAQPRSASPPESSPCSSSSSAGPTRSSPRRRSSARCGTSSSKAIPTTSRCTCAASAARSTTPSTSPPSRPSAVPATASTVGRIERAMRRRGLTVRVRITFGVAVVFALALAVASAFLATRQREALTGDVETTIRLRAADLVAALDGGSLPASIAIPFEDAAFVQIVDRSGKVVRSSPNIEGELAVTDFRPAEPPPAARTLHDLPIGDEPFRVVAESATSGGASFTVYVGGSLKPVDDAVTNLAVALAIGSPALLAVVLALTWVAVGRALRPVERMRVEVDGITESALHRRVPQPPGDDEIGRLAATMNTMLARLEDAATRNRHF